MHNKEKGFLKILLIIVIALIILGALGINIQNVLNSSIVQTNLAWLWNMLLWIWDIIKTPILWVWGILKALFYAGLGALPN